MKTFVLFIGFICLAYSDGFAQKMVHIQGIVKDQNATNLPGCFIKLYKLNQKIPIQYLALGTAHTFSLSLKVSEADSLYIIASHPAKEDHRIFLDLSNDTLRFDLDFILMDKILKLENVIVNSKSIWKSGDTSFYRVDAFASGTEKKLIELIRKLPGLTIHADGNLYFNHKPVSKILIEGDDIFSDKQNLLLENFPAQTIEHIQAIENQTENALLKGLQNENQIIINLKLKQKYLKASFGSLEAGISTNGSYLLNPVIFALLGKIKVGVIGNYNSQGHNSGHRSENELKNLQIKNIETWLPMFSMYTQIPDLPARHYIRNEIKDTRIKFNAGIHKKLKAETEIAFLTDKNTQHITKLSRVLNDSVLMNQQATILYNYDPSKLSIKQSLKFNPNNSSTLNGDFLFYRDHTTQRHQNNQIQNQVADSVFNLGQKNYQSLMGYLSYTRRMNENLALLLNVDYGNHSYQSRETAFSTSLPVIFSLSDSLNMINLNKTVQAENFNLRATLFNKKSKRKYIPALFINYEKINRLDSFLFTSSYNKSKDSVSNPFSNNGLFTSMKIGTSYMNPFKIGSHFIESKIEAAFLHMYVEQGLIDRHEKNMIGELSLSYKKLHSATKHEVNLSLNRDQLPLFTLNSLVTPYRPTVFQQYKNNSPVTNFIQSSYFFNKKYTNRNSFTALVSHSIFLNSNIYKSVYNRFSNITVDSLSNKTTSNSSAMVYYSFNLKGKHCIGLIKGSFFRYENMLMTSDQLSKSISFLYDVGIELTKIIKRKHIIDIEGSVRYGVYHYPTMIMDEEVRNKNIRAWLGLKYENIINKNWSFILNGKLISDDLYKRKAQFLPMLNAEIQWTPDRSKFRFMVLADNLTNRKYFQNMENSSMYFSETSLPLIERNIQFKIYYGF